MTSLIPFVTALIGGLIGIVGTLIVEKSRRKAAQRDRISTQRSEVSLQAFDLAHETLRNFRMIFIHNNDGTDDEADAAQATQVEAFIEADGALRAHLARLRLFGSPKFTGEIESFMASISEYFSGITAPGFRAAEFVPAIESAEKHLEDAAETLRRESVR